MRSRPILLHALKLRQTSHRTAFFRPSLLVQPSPLSLTLRALHTSPRLPNAGPSSSRDPDPSASASSSSSSSSSSSQKGESSSSSQKAESSSSRPPPSAQENAPPQNPFRVFMDVLSEEIQKNKAWQDNVRQLQGDVDKMADSKAMKATRDVYERIRLANLIKNNPRLQEAASELAKQGISVREAVAKALEDSKVIEAFKKSYGWSSETAARWSKPVRDTEAYKMFAETVVDTFDDLGWQGYEEKDQRRQRRQRRAKKAGKNASARVKANPEAGEAVVLSETQSTESPGRLTFLKSSPAYQRFLENYYESETPLYSALRRVGGTFGKLMDENEHAKVMRRMKELDPDWRFDRWQNELREYIVPEVVDAYISADRESLQQWCGEAAFNVAWATIGQYLKFGLVPESRIMEIKMIADIPKAQFLETGEPVFSVLFQTQEVECFKNARTGEVQVGSENRIANFTYGMVLTRLENELDNELTAGWKVLQMARREAK